MTSHPLFTRRAFVVSLQTLEDLDFLFLEQPLPRRPCPMTFTRDPSRVRVVVLGLAMRLARQLNEQEAEGHFWQPCTDFGWLDRLRRS